MRIEDLTYVIPIRWGLDDDIREMTGYIEWLSQRCDVIVVDGSAPEVFEKHSRSWGAIVKHLTPDADLAFAMGKVNGVITGMRSSATDYVVIGDDDVRYSDAGLAAMRAALEGAELVRPQNYFDPLPWHAAWDTSRSLLNRSFRADYPGTLGIRRDFFMRIGGIYDGDTMFENLELMRTVEAAGGEIASRLDIYVRRIPPDTSHFWSQRVRQAYDDLAQPARLSFFLSLWPLIAALPTQKRTGAILSLVLGSIGIAEVGRHRAGGRKFFPAYTSLFAPAWIAERATCSWLAVASRLLRGGIKYGGGVVPKAANSPRELRRLARDRRERSRP